ncbi:DUF4178 domain-containing protein [Jannaschia donghaensis]|uniref:DUF4178 domain-containing protein n=1 Tax=Jannaschia donghaensis TaxID=420998 RepID=A0A0M6YJL3_9RHOB|nr:DUF4178 domain-containing protein [Jannaschia donghaensis]CTQ50140.1 hypothetical protein JDO7802_02158 [Jannaschia donghaensis]
MSDRSCPNCGAALPEILAHARMVNCDFCGTSVVLEDEVLLNAGTSGEMVTAPALIEIGRAVRLPGGEFIATGHVRYDYGRGHWDEYHGALDGDGLWVSVDEGDVVAQQAIDAPKGADRGTFRLDATLEFDGVTYRCTEVSNATAVAFRGQLPEPIVLGDTHLYANFSGPGGMLLSGESWDGGSAWFAGRWIDPFDMKPADGIAS